MGPEIKHILFSMLKWSKSSESDEKWTEMALKITVEGVNRNIYVPLKMGGNLKTKKMQSLKEFRPKTGNSLEN